MARLVSLALLLFASLASAGERSFLVLTVHEGPTEVWEGNDYVFLLTTGGVVRGTIIANRNNGSLDFKPAHQDEIINIPFSQIDVISGETDNQPAPITAEYDKFNNETTVMLTPRGISSSCQLELSAIVQSRGRTERAPFYTGIFFLSGSDTWVYLKTTPQVVFLLDGKRLVLRFTRDGKVRSDGTVSEILGTQLSHNQLRSIASAKSVEFKIGMTECEMSGDNLESLRELVDRTTPKTPKKK